MIGQHLLANLYDVASDRLVDDQLLSNCLDEATRRGGMKPIGRPVLHRFEGGGLTGFLLLSESHIAFHTYPEYRYIAVDVFSCGGAEFESRDRGLPAPPSSPAASKSPRHPAARRSRTAIENL